MLKTYKICIGNKTSKKFKTHIRKNLVGSEELINIIRSQSCHVQ